jgi:hypothetical protein
LVDIQGLALRQRPTDDALAQLLDHLAAGILFVLHTGLGWEPITNPDWSAYSSCSLLSLLVRTSLGV